MPTLQDAAEIGRQDRFLAVVSTLRANETMQCSVVNAGVLAHPVDRADVVGFVTYGRTKLANLRVRPQLSIVYRVERKWIAVEGRAELIGPDDPHPEFSAEQLRLLLREVFVAAGGSHNDWDSYDRIMVEQRRTVVLMRPSRIYSNRTT